MHRINSYKKFVSYSKTGNVRRGHFRDCDVQDASNAFSVDHTC